MTNSSDQQPWTVLRLLDWVTQYFKDRGSDTARLDAEVLLADAMGCERIELYTAFDTEPDETQRTAFREMVRRRGEGAPVAYLVGYKEFYSLRFRVDPNVLIPRPETEHVVIEALDFVRDREASRSEELPMRIADVGTGSGAIAIALATQLADAQIIAVDLSAAALDIARWNAKQHDVENRIEFIEGDLLQNVQQPVDVLCSNPPYVSENEFAALDTEVKDFEPKMALVSGAQGTEIIHNLRIQAADKVAPGGRVIIELSPMIAESVLKEFANDPAYTNARIVKDLARMDRLLVADRAPVST